MIADRDRDREELEIFVGMMANAIIEELRVLDEKLAIVDDETTELFARPDEEIYLQECVKLYLKRIKIIDDIEKTKDELRRLLSLV